MARDTRKQLLDTAQRLVQSGGYNAFSYKDLESRVGIKTASIHYHFPTKADLGVALMQQYREGMEEQCSRLDKTVSSPAKRLSSYIKEVARSLENGSRRCLCGVLAGDVTTLPGSVQQEVRKTIESAEHWLSTLLEAGRSADEFSFEGGSEVQARALFAGLQGAMLSACAFEDEKRFTRAARTLVELLLKR